MNTDELLKLLSFEPKWQISTLQPFPTVELLSELYFRHFINEVELIDFFKRLKEKDSQTQPGLIPTEDVNLK